MSGVVLSTIVDAEGVSVFEATVLAPPQLADYPVEQARVSVFLDMSVVTVPLGDPTRNWHHRYPRWSLGQIAAHNPNEPWPWLSIVGGLCLEYPKDPAFLRWNWSHGFDTYLQLVQRHLWMEEFYRRHHYWPVEDVPHGERSDGKPHPITMPLRRCA